MDLYYSCDRRASINNVFEYQRLVKRQYFDSSEDIWDISEAWLSSISPHNTWIAHCGPNIPNLLLMDQCQFWTIQLSGKISPEYSEIFGRNIFPAN